MQSVLASEPRVLQLMNGIEAAIEEASVVESRLINIDETLGRIREAMAQIRQKNHEIRTANDNVKLLLDLLDDLIVSTIMFFVSSFRMHSIFSKLLI